jgi:hypothetical protein
MCKYQALSVPVLKATYLYIASKWEDSKLSESSNNSVQVFCFKCGHKLIGQKQEDGSLKVFCNRCGVSIFSKPRNNKEINFKIVVSKKAI